MRIIPGSFLGIGKDFVRGLDFGEKPRSLVDIAIIAVWVEFQRFSSVGFFDSVTRSAASGLHGRYRRAHSSSDALPDMPSSS